MRLFSLVNEAPLPDGALLQEFVDRGEYTDCFVAQVGNDVTFPMYVETFYTTRLFRLERLILKWLISRPSSDEEARQLARSETDEFAAWDEYSRADNQLIMMDFRQQTCSWFMLEADERSKRLYFGSAIVPIESKSGAKPRLGLGFEMLLGFHKLYSRLLLTAAKTRLLKLLSADSEKTDS